LDGEIVLDRLERLGVRPIETRAEVMGVDALYPGAAPPPGATPSYEAPDVVRVTGDSGTARPDTLKLIVHEVDALGLNGPAGGSIAAMGVREVLGVVSTFVPRALSAPASRSRRSAPDRLAPPDRRAEQCVSNGQSSV
jgi:hypothetical protein